MKKVYLDTSVWNFLDGQPNTQCESLRPAWGDLEKLIAEKRLRLVTSIVGLQELADAANSHGERAHRLCNRAVAICAPWIMSDFGIIVHREIMCALHRERFTPWLPACHVNTLRKTRVELDVLKSLAADHAAPKQRGGDLLRDIENDFRERIEAHGMPIQGATNLAADRIGDEIAEGTVRFHLMKEGKKVSSKRARSILKSTRAIGAYNAFLIAGAAERVPAQRKVRDSDPLDAYHFGCGAYAHWLVTADASFLRIGKRVKSYPATVMPLYDFCKWVKC